MRTTTVVRIKVNPKHIREGLRESTCNCPVARACRSAGLVSPHVDGCDVEFSTTKGRRIYTSVPAEVTQRIIQYDSTGFMEPFEFDLEVPV